MPVERRVLLARPHAFIVNEMKPFLERAGFLPCRLESLDQLDEELRKPLCGAIISTAISSSVNADAATVFRRVREKLPRLPVLFAGMADFGAMTSLVENAVQGMAPHPVIRGAGETRAPAATARREATFLVLRKEDLAERARLDAALRAVRAHFA
jgi:hypothetical protein